MAGNLTYFGELTIGGCIPAAGALFAAMTANLQTQLDAAIKLFAQIKARPPTIATQIELATNLLARLKIAATLGLPGVDFQMNMVGALIAKIRAQIAVLARFPLGVAGVAAYAYDGDYASFGPTVGAGIVGTPKNHVNALILATSIPATWAAMAEVLIQ